MTQGQYYRRKTERNFANTCSAYCVCVCLCVWVYDVTNHTSVSMGAQLYAERLIRTL
jgi:hypothetical protein